MRGALVLLGIATALAAQDDERARVDRLDDAAALLEAAGHDDAGVRWRAYWRMLRVHVKAGGHLRAAVAALEDDDADVRLAAGTFLMSTSAGQNAAQPALLRGSAAVAKEIAIALERVGPRALRLQFELGWRREQPNPVFWDAVCLASVRFPHKHPGVVARRTAKSILESKDRILGTLAAIEYLVSLGPEAMEALAELAAGASIELPKNVPQKDEVEEDAKDDGALKLRPADLMFGHRRGPRNRAKYGLARLAVAHPKKFIDAFPYTFEFRERAEARMIALELAYLCEELGPLVAPVAPRLWDYRATAALAAVGVTDPKLIAEIVAWGAASPHELDFLDLVASIGPKARRAQAHVRAQTESDDPEVEAAARAAYAQLIRPPAKDEAYFLSLLEHEKDAMRRRGCMGLGAVYAASRKLPIAPALLKQLAARGDVAAAAADAIARRKKSAAQHLAAIEKATSPVPGPRILEAMLRIDPRAPETARVAAEAMTDSGVIDRLRVIHALRSLRGKAHGCWIAALKRTHTMSVRAACEEIVAGRLRGDDVAAALLAAIPVEPIACARAAAKLGLEAASPVYAKELKEGGPATRANAAAALRILGASDEVLAPALADPVLAVRIAALR